MKKADFVPRSIFHLMFLGASVALALAATQYANTFVGPVIPDLILDHVTRVDTSFFFYEGAVILVGFVLLVVIRVPRYIPFTLAAVALFYLIRTLLMVTTHLPSPHPSTGADLFFSGHTGLPFLLSLIFWKYPALRYFFLVASVVAGATVLLSHVHYSIDVLAAPFITYSIYILSKKIFKREYSFI
jgi:hypothetical protein